MFGPRATLSTVRQRTQRRVRRHKETLACAGAVAVLTSCGTPSAAATPHLVTIQSAVTCPAPPVHTARVAPIRHYESAPKAALNARVGYCAYINTVDGVVSIRLRPEYAPKAVNDFVYLAERGFYDGLTFNQICPATAGIACPGQVPVAIAGDPSGSGSGGPGYSLKADPVVGEYLFGAVAMYTSGSNMLGSQFFVSTGDAHALLPRYDIFGQVTDGFPALVALRKGDRILWIAIAVTAPEP